MKLILPLIDKNLIKEDLDEDVGFCGAFCYDKNRPYLDNHIFLVYDICKSRNKNYEREVRFENHTNISGSIVSFINKKPYKIYAYPIYNTDIKRLLRKARAPILSDSVNRILLFWKGTDEQVRNAIFSRKPGKIIPDFTSVPEYDDQNDISINQFNKKGDLY